MNRRGRAQCKDVPRWLVKYTLLYVAPIHGAYLPHKQREFAREVIALASIVTGIPREAWPNTEMGRYRFAVALVGSPSAAAWIPQAPRRGESVVLERLWAETRVWADDLSMRERMAAAFEAMAEHYG